MLKCVVCSLFTLLISREIEDLKSKLMTKTTELDEAIKAEVYGGRIII